MDLNTTFHDRWLADHLVASTTLDANHWILFDSGASANCCPKDFGSEWPLLPLNGEPPPLRSISGQPLHVYGRRLIRMTLDGFPACFHFTFVMFLTQSFRLPDYFYKDTRSTWTPLIPVLWQHQMDKKHRLKILSPPGWTRQQKALWMTSRHLFCKQLPTLTLRLLSSTSMIDGWTFRPLMFVCTMRSVRLCMCHLTTVRVLFCRTLRRHVWLWSSVRMVPLNGYMTIGMGVVKLSLTELLLVQRAFARLIWTLEMILFPLSTTLWRKTPKVWNHLENQLNLRWWNTIWPIYLSEVGAEFAFNPSQGRIPAGLWSLVSQFFTWTIRSLETNLASHKSPVWTLLTLWVDLHFPSLFLAKAVLFMRRLNFVGLSWMLDELLASCKRILSHPWNNWLRHWQARLEDFLTELHQQDGNKLKGLLETCRLPCIHRFALCLLMSNPGMMTLKSQFTAHFTHGFSDMHSGWSTDTCRNQMGFLRMGPEVSWLYLQLRRNFDVPSCECRTDSTFMAWWNLAWTRYGVRHALCRRLKTRSIRRNIPSKQACLELLQSITATPWDPTGSKSETDAFILPLSKDAPQPLSKGPSKEDFVADQESDGYEPESPLPNNFADLPSHAINQKGQTSQSQSQNCYNKVTCHAMHLPTVYSNMPRTTAHCQLPISMKQQKPCPTMPSKCLSKSTA